MDAVTSSTALTICTQVVAFMPPNTDVGQHQDADADHRDLVVDADQPS